MELRDKFDFFADKAPYNSEEPYLHSSNIEIEKKRINHFK